MDEPGHLGIGASAVDGVVVITLAGELDLASAPALADVINDAASSGAELVIVDLRGLDFMDSTGISVLVKAHQAAAKTPTPVRRRQRITTGRSHAGLTGLDEQMTLFDAPEKLLHGSWREL